MIKLVIECSGCDRSFCAGTFSQAALVRVARVAGWKISAPHLCPHCLACREDERPIVTIDNLVAANVGGEHGE